MMKKSKIRKFPRRRLVKKRQQLWPQFLGLSLAFLFLRGMEFYFSAVKLTASEISVKICSTLLVVFILSLFFSFFSKLHQRNYRFWEILLISLIGITIYEAYQWLDNLFALELELNGLRQPMGYLFSLVFLFGILLCYFQIIFSRWRARWINALTGMVTAVLLLCVWVFNAAERKDRNGYSLTVATGDPHLDFSIARDMSSFEQTLHQSADRLAKESKDKEYTVEWENPKSSETTSTSELSLRNSARGFWESSHLKVFSFNLTSNKRPLLVVLKEPKVLNWNFWADEAVRKSVDILIYKSAPDSSADWRAQFGELKGDIEALKTKFPWDPRQIIVFGEGDAATAAHAFAFYYPDLVSAVVAVDGSMNPRLKETAFGSLEHPRFAALIAEDPKNSSKLENIQSDAKQLNDLGWTTRLLQSKLSSDTFNEAFDWVLGHIRESSHEIAERPGRIGNSN